MSWKTGISGERERVQVQLLSVMTPTTYLISFRVQAQLRGYANGKFDIVWAVLYSVKVCVIVFVIYFHGNFYRTILFSHCLHFQLHNLFCRYQ